MRPVPGARSPDRVARREGTVLAEWTETGANLTGRRRCGRERYKEGKHNSCGTLCGAGGVAGCGRLGRTV